MTAAISEFDFDNTPIPSVSQRGNGRPHHQSPPESP